MADTGDMKTIPSPIGESVRRVDAVSYTHLTLPTSDLV